MPSLGLRFSSLIASPAAGNNHAIDFKRFKDAGCEIVENGNTEVLKSPCGDDDFVAAYSSKQVAKHIKVVDQLLKLEDPHVAYYLLRWSCNASRLNYLARTTPAAACSDALKLFDHKVMDVLAGKTGLPLDA